MTDLGRRVERVQRATAVVGVVVGCFLGLVYFTLTTLMIASGMRVFVWQIPVAGALIGASTGLLARALSMQRPLWRWLLLQAATILVVFAGFGSPPAEQHRIVTYAVSSRASGNSASEPSPNSTT